MQVWRYILGGRVGVSVGGLGPTCHLFIVKVLGRTWRILVDCGLEPVHNGLGWRGIDLQLVASLLQGEKIDFVLLTHAHLDHCGYIPALEPFFKDSTKIICTTTTAALLSYIYSDALSLAVRKFGGLGPKPFTLMQVLKSLTRIHIVESPQVVRLTEGIEVLVWPAGHIHGACSFFFRISENGIARKFAFLGDYATHDQVLIQGAPLPPEEWQLTGKSDAILWLDCTNGAGDLPPWREVLDEIADEAGRVVEEGGNWIGITFSIVRWQLLVHELCRRIERKGNSPVLLADGPSAQHVAHVLSKCQWWGERKFDFSGAAIVRPRSGRHEFAASLQGAWLLTPSGMGHGPATEYLATGLENPRNFFAFTGFLVEGSNGKKVMDAEDGEKIVLEDVVDENGDPRPVSVRAKRKQHRLTGHQHRLDGVCRALETCGVDPRAVAKWNEEGRTRNIREYLPDADLTRLACVHFSFQHGERLAHDWFCEYFLGLAQTSRGDRESDRFKEF